MLPTIPTINFVISKKTTDPSVFFYEEFESFKEMLQFVMFDMPEVSDSIVKEWNYQSDKATVDDYRMLKDYAGDHLEQFLGECGYTLTRVVKG